MRTPQEYLEVAAKLEREARLRPAEHERQDFHLAGQHWLNLALNAASQGLSATPVKSR
jgi:hypothetical protein